MSYTKLGSNYKNTLKGKKINNDYFSHSVFMDLQFGVELEVIGSLNRFDSAARVNNCILEQSDRIFLGMSKNSFKKKKFSLNNWSRFMMEATSNHGGISHKGQPNKKSEGSAGWRLEEDRSVGLPYFPRQVVYDNKTLEWNGILFDKNTLANLNCSKEKCDLNTNIILPINGTHENFASIEDNVDMKILLNKNYENGLYYGETIGTKMKWSDKKQKLVKSSYRVNKMNIYEGQELVSGILNNEFVELDNKLPLNSVRNYDKNVSPIGFPGSYLYPEGLINISHMMAHFKSHDIAWIVNKSTGFHVHLSKKDLDNKPNGKDFGFNMVFFKLWYCFEPLFCSYLNKDRVQNLYANLYQQFYLAEEVLDDDFVEKELKGMISGIKNQEFDQSKSLGTLRTPVDHPRYFSVNYTTINTIGTIEIRMKESTLNSEDIQQWVLLYQNFYIFCYQTYKSLGKSESLKLVNNLIKELIDDKLIIVHNNKKELLKGTVDLIRLNDYIKYKYKLSDSKYLKSKSKSKSKLSKSKLSKSKLSKSKLSKSKLSKSKLSKSKLSKSTSTTKWYLPWKLTWTDDNKDWTFNRRGKVSIKKLFHILHNVMLNNNDLAKYYSYILLKQHNIVTNVNTENEIHTRPVMYVDYVMSSKYPELKYNNIHGIVPNLENECSNCVMNKEQKCSKDYLDKIDLSDWNNSKLPENKDDLINLSIARALNLRPGVRESSQNYQRYQTQSELVAPYR